MKAFLVTAILVPASLLVSACSSNTGVQVSPTTAPAKTAQAQQKADAVATPDTKAAPSPAAKPTNAAEAKPTAVAAPTSPEVYKVGDTIKVQDHTLTVLSAKQDGSKLLVEVQINNTGQKEITVSSLASFSAKTIAGEKLRVALPGEGGTLDGKVLPNDKLKGNLAYTVPDGAKGLKLYYTPSILGEGAIVVALDEEAQKTPFPRPSELSDAKPFAKGTTYKPGDAIAHKGVVIKLTSAKLDNNTLTASFVVYNGGQKDVALSSLVSFEAKDSEGTKGKYKLQLEGTPLDGKLVPGDTLKGDLSWEFQSGAKDIKVYFTEALFVGDTLVWATQ